MLNGNTRKNFTACNDMEAEILLEKVLSEMKETLSGTELCVVLGGSYGRGDGGVRIDRANGILYNDLDFFVFSRRKSPEAAELLKEWQIFNSVKQYEYSLRETLKNASTFEEIQKFILLHPFNHVSDTVWKSSFLKNETEKSINNIKQIQKRFSE